MSAPQDTGAATRAVGERVIEPSQPCTEAVPKLRVLEASTTTP